MPENTNASSDWNWIHWRTISIAGIGFLTDSYDNFIIGLMVPMIAYVYYPDSKGLLNPIEDGWLKSAATYGNLIGQLLYGVLGDMLGRQRLYGTELIILMIGAFGSALAFEIPGKVSVITMLSIWRFVMGIGVGGDYPISGVIVSEFVSAKHRGTMVALVFAMQGVGIILAILITCLTLMIFQDAIKQDVQNLDYVWRIMAGFGFIPAACTVYFRLTFPETPHYNVDVHSESDTIPLNLQNPLVEKNTLCSSQIQKLYLSKFFHFFGQWKYAKILFATCFCWFLLDIGFYGTNLNTSVVLHAIGYSDTNSPFNHAWSAAIGALMIAISGQVPGYFFTVYFIDRWGRKPIQLVGFMVLAICFVILGTFYDYLTTSSLISFVIIYSLAQFFFNFGPNATTYIIPTEVFPTAVRSTAHGLSAISGKVGAIVAAQGFSHLVNIGGEQKFMGGTLVIFGICCFLGFLCTFLLPETKSLELRELHQENENIESIPLVDR